MDNAEVQQELEQILFEYRRYPSYGENRSKTDLPWISSAAILEKEHGFLAEIRRFFDEGHDWGALACSDLRSSLEILRLRGTLSAEAVYGFLELFRSTAAYRELFKDRNDLPLVNDLALDIADFRRLSAAVESVVLPDFSIADRASPELSEIRGRIRRETSSIDQTIAALAARHREFLAQEGPLTKNGLPVLPVKNTFRSRIKGVVEEISNSGETYYIVPVEILDINNRIYALREKERSEEERILRTLSESLGARLSDLERTYSIGLRFDDLCARVRFGASYRGTIAAVSDDGLWLEDFVHPLLDPSSAVYNSLRLDRKRPVLIVTGPNAGGKTVLLKAVALAVLMNQRGLLVSTRGQAVLPVFDKVVYVGGDSQSLSANLSTFSGHLHNLNRGLTSATSRSLLLFDELGQGTAPVDGEALALAVVDHVLDLGAYGLVTSHFDRLKERALDDPRIVPAAMIFDEEKIAPTFRLKCGMVGQSYAIEVARRVGFIESIVERADRYLKSFNDTPEKRAVHELESLLDEAQKRQARLEAQEAELARLTAKRKNAIAELEKARNGLTQRADRKIEEIVEERLRALDEIWNPERKVTSLPEMSRIKGELKKAVAPREPDQAPRAEFAVGDYVRVLKAGSNGRIVARSGAFFRVECGGLTIKCAPTDLERLPEPQSASKRRPTASLDRLMSPKTGVGLECNLIGLRVEEALARLGKYLDDCLLMHYHQVRIVHGVGTGALRNAVRAYLERSPLVESFRFGGEGEGGVGSTVVTLR